MLGVLYSSLGTKFKKDIDKLELVTRGRKEKDGLKKNQQKETIFFKEWLKKNKAIQLSFTVTRWKRNKLVYFALKVRNRINERVSSWKHILAQSKEKLLNN